MNTAPSPCGEVSPIPPLHRTSCVVPSDIARASLLGIVERTHDGSEPQGFDWSFDAPDGQPGGSRNSPDAGVGAVRGPAQGWIADPKVLDSVAVQVAGPIDAHAEEVSVERRRLLLRSGPGLLQQRE